MSQIIVKKCNFCAAINSTNNPDWISLYGVGKGNSNVPIQTFPKKTFDVCGTCAAAKTIASLLELYSKK